MNKYTSIQLLDIIGKIKKHEDLNFYYKKIKDIRYIIVKKLKQLIKDRTINLEYISYINSLQRNEVINRINKKIINISNKKFYFMTLNKLVDFYNTNNTDIITLETLDILPLITRHKSSFKDIIKVNYLFECQITPFFDINTLLSLRLVSKIFKRLVYNSRITDILCPKQDKNIEFIFKIFKYPNSWNLSYTDINNNYKYNIINLNSLNVLILMSSNSIEELIVNKLSNTYYFLQTLKIKFIK